MTNEEYVRANWKRAEICSSGPSRPRFCVSLGGHGFTRANVPANWASSKSAAWSAAAEFTRDRLEQIAEIEEEISVLQSLHVGLDKIAALIRCGRRAESALTDLRRGMK